jgi:hypothetical protein
MKRFAILEDRSDICVIFTDIQPGSMDGLKLAAAVRGRWPLCQPDGLENARLRALFAPCESDSGDVAARCCQKPGIEINSLIVVARRATKNPSIARIKTTERKWRSPVLAALKRDDP